MKLTTVQKEVFERIDTEKKPSSESEKVIGELANLCLIFVKSGGQLKQPKCWLSPVGELVRRNDV